MEWDEKKLFDLEYEAMQHYWEWKESNSVNSLDDLIEEIFHAGLNAALFGKVRYEGNLIKKVTIEDLNNS